MDGTDSELYSDLDELEDGKVLMTEQSIFLRGDITQNLVDNTIKILDDYLTVNVPNIRLSITSEGGDLYAAYTLCDYLRWNIFPEYPKAESLITGYVFSAAYVIASQFPHRVMSKYAMVMVHNTTVTLHGMLDRITALQKIPSHLDNLAYLDMVDRSNLSLEEVVKLHDNEVYLTADECLRMGLVDEVR